MLSVGDAPLISAPKFGFLEKDHPTKSSDFDRSTVPMIQFCLNLQRSVYTSCGPWQETSWLQGERVVYALSGLMSSV